jgi:hypothetical protein
MCLLWVSFFGGMFVILLSSYSVESLKYIRFIYMLMRTLVAAQLAASQEGLISMSE